MVKNGYILKVSTNQLQAFLSKVRTELKDEVREQVLMQIAKTAERLYDMKFVEQRKYDSSILDMAIASAAQRISGVALGAFKDPLFDFRATLIIAKADAHNERQFVLLNTENGLIRYYFEKLEEVEPFKFDRFLDSEDPDQEENECRGVFWHNLLQESNWNLNLTGYAAQLSVQPNISTMNITAEDLRAYFSDPEIRRMDYVKHSVIISKVQGLLGSTPIEQTNPYTLLEYFDRAYAYINSEQGQDECLLFDEKVKPGFCNVDVESLELSE